MVGIWLVGGADDASTLVEIFSAAVSIFSQVLFYKQKKGLFSSLSSAPVDAPLHFLFLVFLVFSTFSTGFGTISSSSSLAASDDISPGHDVEDPLTCALPNTSCISSRNFGPYFRNFK
jgi:hypothetical protein